MVILHALPKPAALKPLTMMNYDGVVFFKTAVQADKPVSSKWL